MPEGDAGCPVSINLHFIPLRQGLLLNPELGWRPASSTTTLASSLHSARVTGACVVFYMGAGVQLGFSCLHSKCSRSLVILPALALHCHGAPCLLSALFGLSWAIFHSGDYRTQI